MEPIGFKKGLDKLLDEGINVKVVTTDRHPSIRKMMREDYPDIAHQFDPWHVAKGKSISLMTCTTPNTYSPLFSVTLCVWQVPLKKKNLYVHCLRSTFILTFFCYNSGIKKKLVMASNRKHCKDLAPWVRSVSNHMWWSCSSSKGDEKVQAYWIDVKCTVQLLLSQTVDTNNIIALFFFRFILKGM